LRFGELLGLEVRHFTGDAIRVEQSVWCGTTQSPKTANANRVVDLHPDICKVLRDYLGDRKGGYIFPARHQGAVTEKLYKVQKLCNVQLSGMHSFRRFRATYLRNHTTIPVSHGLVLSWMGWSTKASMAEN
jgi:integrase